MRLHHEQPEDAEAVMVDQEAEYWKLELNVVRRVCHALVKVVGMKMLVAQMWQRRGEVDMLLVLSLMGLGMVVVEWG